MISSERSAPSTAVSPLRRSITEQAADRYGPYRGEVEIDVVDIPSTDPIPIIHDWSHPHIASEYAIQFDYMRRRYQDAVSVRINNLPTGINGLGDRVMALRSAINLAAHAQEKPVYIDTDPSLAGMKTLLLPPNVTLSAGNSHKNLLGGTLNIDFTDYDQSFAGPHQISNDTARLLARAELPPDVVSMMSEIDLHRFYLARALGLPMRTDTMLQSIIDPDKLPDRQIRDLLLIPAAKEGKDPVENRSLKSISIRKWEAAFKLMREWGYQGRIGVIASPENPDYTGSVVVGAASAALKVQLIRTPTLDDLVREVGQLGRVVGMDTGPMHLAVDVVKAAKERGHSIQFRQFFNGQLFDDRSWRTAFPYGHDAKTMVYHGDPNHTRTGGHIYGYSFNDISNLNPHEIALFTLVH